MFWRKKKKPTNTRIEPYTKVIITYQEVTPEQIEAYQQRQMLWQALKYSSNTRHSSKYENNSDDNMYDPFYHIFREMDQIFEETEAEFQRMFDEAEKPFRDLEAKLGYMGSPGLGDITVIDSKTYMVTSATIQYGVRMMQD